MDNIDRSAALEARARLTEQHNANVGIYPPYDPTDPVNRAKRAEEGVPAPDTDPNNPKGTAEVSNSNGNGDGSSAPNTVLPDDFPGLEPLRLGGFDTLAKVKALTREQLLEVPSIGAATADKILAYLAG